MESRTVKTNLLVSVEAICRRRIDHRAPGVETDQKWHWRTWIIGPRAPPLTEDSHLRDEIPEFVQLFSNR
jgi:hypothetical protein